MRIAGNPKRTQTDKEEVETWSKGKQENIPNVLSTWYQDGIIIETVPILYRSIQYISVFKSKGFKSYLNIYWANTRQKYSMWSKGIFMNQL